MGVLSLLAAGAALKVEASKIAEVKLRTESVIRIADARAELFLRFFIFVFGVAAFQNRRTLSER